MKKTLAIFLALIIIISGSFTALADETTPAESSDPTVVEPTATPEPTEEDAAKLLEKTSGKSRRNGHDP